jgi:hypothetical protein
MFGSSKPVVLERYGRRRSRWRLPRWLVLLLLGVGLGAAGVIVVQERYLPARLSAADSVKLQADFARADADRLRLNGELAQTAQRLDAATADTRKLAEQLAASQAGAEQLREDLVTAIAALPPDPRGGAVEVRAGRLAVKGGALAYELVLTRERAGGKTISGALQFVVTGESSRGGESSVTLKPVAATLGAQAVLRGSAPLPEGLRPRQVTIQVLDAPGGRLLGMRVLRV